VAAGPSLASDEQPCQEAPGSCSCDPGVRSLRVLGYVPGGRVPGLDCDQPLRVVCGICAGALTWPCRAHRASKCLPCSERYRRLLVRVAESRSAAPGRLYGSFLTLTAPGHSEHARWVPGRPGGGARCGCHRENSPDGLAAWNASASAAWNRLRLALSRVTDLEYFRAVEVQRRGALHLHVIVWSADPLAVAEVQALALAAGFGCVLDLSPIRPEHARYVAKYATKGSDSRDSVPWARVVQVLDDDTGELLDLVNRDPSFRTWSSSRSWGVTVKAVRAAQRAHVAMSHVARPADAGSTDTQEPATDPPPAECPEPAPG
jgi:hypothetical protein